MKSKKLKLITITFASLFISTSLLVGCGKKEAEEKANTTVKEIDGKKVKVTEQGDGTAKIEMPSK